MDNMIDLEKLSQVMREKEVNVTTLSRRIGRDRVVVSGWKNGRRIPNLESALCLAKGLGVPVEDICYEVALPGDEAA
jgi:transcriptional regulator with XRE-family HTH domain